MPETNKQTKIENVALPKNQPFRIKQSKNTPKENWELTHLEGLLT